MANKVNQSPALPAPLSLTSLPSVSDFLTQLINSMRSELSDHALRLNNAMLRDGTEAFTAPAKLKRYPKASLPSAATYVDAMIIVNDDVGGLTPAFSDGTNWRRTADRNIIS